MDPVPAILHTWISEVMRGRRASWYLATLEPRINEELRFSALSWEQTLRTSDDPRMKFRREHYFMTKLFFLGTGLVSGGVGAQILFTRFLSLAGTLSALVEPMVVGRRLGNSMAGVVRNLA